MSSDILIVDDEEDIRNLIQGILEDEGYSTREAGSSEAAYAAVKDKVPALIVLDIWLQGSEHDGLEILRTLKKQYPHLPFVMISGHGTIETAVSAIKDGAYDFIEKPFKSDRLLMLISRALETASLRRENAALKKKASGSAETLIGKSQAIQGIQDIIDRAAPTNSRILIKGDAGTGKDIVARLIHEKSKRSDEVFTVLNCATMRPDRLEIELFGSEAGVNGEPEHIGIFQQAQGGTLLLDEVGDMPLETQGKILRVLQEQKFQRIGGNETIESDVRVLATTNKDLNEAIKNGDFREDLYYRLNVVEIEMPLLKARSEDIPVFAESFLKGFLKKSDEQEKTFSNAAISVLKAYSWPGNIRQLKNMMEWVSIMHGGLEGAELDVEHLPPELTGKGESGDAGVSSAGKYVDLTLRDAREEFEREYLLSQVSRFDGNISKTAQFVGMERSALHRKLKSLQINLDKDDARDTADEANRKRA